jgi:hypothetical protein
MSTLSGAPPLGVCGALVLWCLFNSGRQFGPFLFLGGVALMGLAWFMLTSGKDEGEFDLDHMIAKVER